MNNNSNYPFSFKILILGNGSATPAFGRHLSAQILEYNQQYILIDAGESTQFRLNKLKIKSSKINHIFISHMHGDHIFGLPGMLSSWLLLGRKKELHIFGPVGIKEYIDFNFKVSGIVDCYPIHYTEIEFEGNQNREFVLNDKLKVVSVPLNHSLPCFGFVFIENKLPYKLDMAKIQALPIVAPDSRFEALKRGENIVDNNGKAQDFNDLTFPPPRSRKYFYCTDTRVLEGVLSIFENYVSGTIYHEATFLEEHKNLAEMTLHSTSKEAANFALENKFDKLLLGHFSGRYKFADKHVEESKSIFENSHEAKEGEWFEIT